MDKCVNGQKALLIDDEPNVKTHSGEVNFKTAVKWYTLAAEQGHALAQHNLGVMYHNGLGVPQNHKTAFKWFTLAAEQGLAPAQYYLGVMHGNGEGVTEDFVRAHMWFNIAVSNGENTEARDSVAQKMAPVQLKEAQRLTREWLEKRR